MKRPTFQQPTRAVPLAGGMSPEGYFLHRIEHLVVVSAIFGVSVVFASQRYYAKQFY